MTSSQWNADSNLDLDPTFIHADLDTPFFYAQEADNVVISSFNTENQYRYDTGIHQSIIQRNNFNPAEVNFFYNKVTNFYWLGNFHDLD